MAELFGIDLFNTEYKKRGVNKLKKYVSLYKHSFANLKFNLLLLNDNRDTLSNDLSNSEQIIDNIKNKPMELQTKNIRLKQESKNYRTFINEVKDKSEEAVKLTKEGTSGSAALGAAASLGGPALSALVSSLGTASTGAAISGLSGAAATNATLAWLGGGSIAAGGAGVAGGEAVLGAIPIVGWALSGVTLAATGFFVNNKNGKTAKQAYKKAEKVEAGIKSTDLLSNKENILSNETIRSSTNIEKLNDEATEFPNDFDKFTDKQIIKIGVLVNNALSAEKILQKSLKSAS
ncbi:hypothetical protein [Apilactobacillus timberlakei]|uniref:Uncharacterized protein n=1 Tax=Apilactobacillus timberlakei TaxID=2008380 RepID=A0ABY2YSM4_9LACO|nr:hypothetical protein [Apilactobacillus timberlakei]TPR14257.1 hypothetical protein DY048_04740 [Apilactobacillus timberlakei]TPR16510.1 hypothetical protein DY052_02830 [Apilactobacillus timberlakei]